MACRLPPGSSLSPPYVEQREGAYYISGTRVSLDSIVWLEQVYGAITFYLAHRQEVDRCLEAQQGDFEAKRRAARDTDPMFYEKLAAARRTIQTPS